jgi:hypothetical protein
MTDEALEKIKQAQVDVRMAEMILDCCQGRGFVLRRYGRQNEVDVPIEVVSMIKVWAEKNLKEKREIFDAL